MQESLETNGAQPSRPHLFTVEEFQRHMASHAKGIWIGLAALLGPLIAFYAIIIAFCSSMAPASDGPRQPFAFVVVALFLLVHLVIIGGSGAIVDRLRGRCRIICPHCAKQLEVNTGLPDAIALHGCPHCHKPLFQEWSDHSVILPPPLDAQPARGEFTFADLAGAERKRGQAIGKRLVVVAILAIIVLGITFAVLWAWHDWLTATFGHMTQDVANGIRFVPAAIVITIGFFWTCFRHPRAFPRCGGCGMALINLLETTRLTGNCTTCGRRVIHDAPRIRSDEDPPQLKPIEHAQLKAWTAQYQRCVVWSMIIIIGLGSLAWMWLVSWWFGISWNRKDVPLCWVLLVYSGMFVLMMVAGWGWRVLSKRRCCPYCNTTLLDQAKLLQTTGNCSHCGRRLLAPVAASS